MWVGEHPAKTASVHVLAFAPDNRTLYSGDNQGHVLAWDLSSRTHRVLFRRPFTAPGFRTVSWLWPTPDGRRLLTQHEHRLIDALHPDAEPILDPGPGERGYFRYVFPDGRLAAKVDPDRGWGVDWWDLETGLRVPVPGPLGQAGNVLWHALLPDGVTVLTHTYYTRPDLVYANELILWDVRTGERVGELTPTGPGISASSWDGRPCLSPDGHTLALGRDKTLWLYDVPSRSLRHRIVTKRKLTVAMAFHPEGRLLASAVSHSQVGLWDVLGKRQVGHYDWKCGSVNALAFALDGQTCAAGGYAKVVVWDVDVN